MDNTQKTREELVKALDDLMLKYNAEKGSFEKEISGLKKSLEIVSRSEEKFRKVYMTSPDSININRLSDGMYVSVNEGFTRIVGYSEQEVSGKTSKELNIWMNPEERLTLVNELKQKGEVKNFEAQFLGKGGKLIYGLMAASILELDGIPHILSITRDITLRKKAEEDLAQEQYLMEAIMNNLPDHVYFKDLESRFIRINKDHAQSFGLKDPSEAVGKSDFDFFTREHAQQAYDDEQKIIHSGKQLIHEERLTWENRPDTWSSTVKLPLLDNKGKIVGTFGISRDITEKKKTEEQFFLLAHALKSVNECVSITDMNDKVLFLNHAFLKTYGFDEKDLHEESISFIRSPNNPQEITDQILPATLSGGWSGELLNRRKDGSEFPVFLSTAIVKNSKGQPVALIGVANDITETKKTEEALKQSEERFRSVAQSANDAIVTTDRKGNILGWNKGAERAFGFSEEEILGKSLDLIIPEEYIELHVDGMKRQEMSGVKHVIGKTVELHGQKKNKVIFPLELSLSEWETSDGKFFTGIIRDITKRKRTESENQVIYEITQGVTTTSRLDELLNLIHKSLGKVVYADNFFVALHDKKTSLFSFPYFVDKYDSVPLPTTMGKSCTAYVFRTANPLLLSGGVFDNLVERGDVELVGSPSPSWVGLPLQTPSGNIGVLVLQHYEKEDVYTDSDLKFLSSIGSQIAIAIERKISEEEIKLKNELLLAINAEKDKFFSILAHDLRGPMSSFVAVTQILTEEIQSMSLAEIREITVAMKASASSIFSLLENLLEWSRLKRGVLEFEPERFIIKDKVEEAIEAVSATAHNKEVIIEIEVPVDLAVEADSHMFEAIVRNLVSNAVKFTPRGGKIYVSAIRNNENSVEIKVRDTGIGMTPELIGKLFRISEKTSRKGTEDEPSSGLGLLLCKEFLEKHNGKIWVESETGKGSTFSFMIPAGM
jgi:PAS domain S-box-containing protein